MPALGTNIQAVKSQISSHRSKAVADLGTLLVVMIKILKADIRHIFIFVKVRLIYTLRRSTTLIEIDVHHFTAC